MILTSFSSRSPRPLDHVQHRSLPGRGSSIQVPDNDGQSVFVPSICGGATDAMLPADTRTARSMAFAAAAPDTSGGNRTFAATAKWQCVNGESRRSISHGSRVFSAMRKAAPSPNCQFAAMRLKFNSDLCSATRSGQRTLAGAMSLTANAIRARTFCGSARPSR
jgi:hypothetical protein